MIKKAMVLAAGLGTRLRPLTNHYPKPLVPIANEPLLGIHLRQLASLGVEEVMVNLHHLPQRIKERLGDGSEYGVRLHYSLEQPEILGTGGGLAEVADFFAEEEAFYFLNGDILHDIDLATVAGAHAKSGAAATLLLRAHPNDGKTGWIGVDGQRVTRVPEMPESTKSPERKMFTGLHILTPKILTHLKKGSFGCVLRTGYRAMLEAGLHILGYDISDAPWRDIGNPGSYLEANWWRLAHEKLATIGDQVQSGKDVTIAENASLGENVIIGDGVVIGAGAQLTNCVIMPGAEIAANARVQNAIVMTDQIIAV